MKARVISTKPKGKAVVLFYDCSNHQNSYINWNPHNIFETHDLVLNLTHTWNVKCAWRNLGNNKINKKNCRTFLIHIIINSRNCVKNVLTNCDVLNKTDIDTWLLLDREDCSSVLKLRVYKMNGFWTCYFVYNKFELYCAK
jgi:hypothetical protein